jgi:hypothetical protein
LAFSKEISYEGSADATYGPFDQYWCGQTFTTTDGFDLTKVGWYIGKTGSPPNGIIHVYATSAGLPTGASLGSQALVAADVSTAAWVEWEFDTPVTLSATTQYAICIDPVDGDVSNRFTVSYDNTSPSYTGGTYVASSNDGSSWTSTAGNDFLFRVYSGQAANYVDMTGTSSLTFGASASLNLIRTLTGTSSLTFTASGVLTFGPLTGAREEKFKTRLIGCGNDEFWYEDS